MIKRKGENQIRNLIFDHKSLESRGQMRFDWSVLHTIGNIFSRAIRNFLRTFKTNLIWKRYECPKFWDNKSPSFGTSTWESQEKWCTPKLLDGLNWKSKGEDSGRKRNWGTFPSSQHFEGRGVFWNSKMGTRKIDKQVNYSHKPAQTKQQVG